MRTTLTDLWQGNIHPTEERTENHKQEIELYAYLERHYNDLEKMLDEKGRAVLAKLKDCYTELSFCEGEDAFIQGFSLAVRLMTEAMA